MAFAENLKELRKEKEIGQETLALELSVSVKTVSHWETGYTQPSIEQLIKIADYFGVSTDELLGRK